jgi:integrase/recombinase XerD
MLTDSVKTYLSVRRALGFKLQSVEKYLWSYANFATARGDIRVLSKTAVEWAALAFSENQRANRLKVLIRFARFAHAEDSDHQIPSDNIFCGRLIKSPNAVYLYGRGSQTTDFACNASRSTRLIAAAYL